MRDNVFLTFDEFERLRDRVDSTIDAYQSKVRLNYFEFRLGNTRDDFDDGHFILFDYGDGVLSISERVNYVHTEFGGYGPVVYSVYVERKRIDDKTEKFVITKEHYLDEEVKKRFDEVFSFINDAFWIIQGAFELYDNDVFDVEEKKVVRKKQGTKKRLKDKTKKSVVRLYKCYTLSKSWSGERKAGIKRKITCPCWGVRGHHRHYKSGKVIFVNAYRKGKNRGKYQGKEYKFFGGDNSEQE